MDAVDIELKSPTSSDFLTVSRNLLGVDAYTNFSSWKRLKMSNALGGGVAKGKYVRQKLEVQNGVQGPYKLYGASNEMGIVIVAGSERVYVDGVQLVRGQEKDYVMDYNTAEITFTPAQMMAAEKRVYVEFEYTDRHFTRYNLFSYNDFVLGEKQKVRLHVNFYQEQDLKNQSIQPELNNSHKLFLSQLGDNLDSAYYNYADSAAYSPDRVLYCLKDTLVDGVLYPSVYEYSTDAGKQLYSVGFTYMGPNKGSYVLLRSTSNGRVFGWVAPENGVLKGDYNPVLLLTTPKLSQMATLRAEYEFQPKSFVQTELAMSNYDQNLFSKEDDRDNVGFAYSLLLNYDRPLKSQKDTANPWNLRTVLDWQFVHKNFHAIESFREVEFARDYNLTEDYSSNFSEQMLHALVGMAKKEVSDSRYEVNWFFRMGDYSAIRQTLWTRNSLDAWKLDAKTTFLISKDSMQKSNYWTADALAAYSFKSVEIGAMDKMEYNLFTDQQTDTIRGNSFAFNEFQFYIKNTDASYYIYNIYYKNRIEYALMDKELGINMTIHEASALFSFERIKNQHFLTRFTYRGQQARSLSEQSKMEHYFVGNLEYTGRFFKNALILNTYYEAGSGMEQKKCFSYLKVATGQGTYVWNDYNGNGIEELDEFEVASFQDEANYVKIWLSSADYVNTYNNQLTQSIQLRPAAVWSGKSGFKRFLARFSNVATLRTQLKNEKLTFNPFYANLNDTNLVSRMLNLNNTFLFNNSSSKFAFDFVVQRLQNKNLLYYGYELNQTDLQQVVLKSHPCDLLQLRAEYSHGRVNNQSEFLSNRCYDIEKHKTGASVILQYQSKCRGEISYMFENKDNRIGEERLFSHDLSAGFEYRMAKRGVVSATLSYVHIIGQVEENTAVAYQMLNGLDIGNNALWHIDYQLAVTEFLQLSLQYDGRASEGHKVVHTGNVVIKAQF